MSNQSNESTLGRLIKLAEADVRVIWPREDQHLSVWMKDNIEILNEALGLQIEIDEAESSVGEFRLDLAGTEASTQSPVVIENQFGDSNHDHLGKLITYSAGREAGILIWVASEFREPHRIALDWLNSISGKDMLFYGVELEVFKIDDSKPAAKYTVIAEPPLSKRPTAISSTPSARALAYRDFWADFLSHLKINYPGVTRASAAQPFSWFSTGAGLSGFSVGAAFTYDGGFQVELYIDTGIKEQNERALAELKISEASIIQAIGEPLEWQELPERRGKRIRLAREGSIEDSPDMLQEYIIWGTGRMAKFKDVFRPRLTQLVL